MESLDNRFISQVDFNSVSSHPSKDNHVI
jgi:hypothetical protein